jgi:AcrR family transcriptional regulator
MLESVEALEQKGVYEMNTRERIIEMAIRLFNEQSTGAVSTNHIAGALEMSPGNLYYHFRNKEEIIRAILERMIARWEALYALPMEHALRLVDVQQVVTENFLLLWEYRFFYRELSILIQRDPVLKERYQQIRRERLSSLEALLQQLMNPGMARSLQTPAPVTNLARLCWLISDYWLPFLEIDGELALPEVIEQGVALYMQVLRPYIGEAETALEVKNPETLPLLQEKTNQE